MNNHRFEEIREEDLGVVTEIYNYYVLNSTATFHMEALSVQQMRGQVFFEDPRYRTFVIKDLGEISGYVLLMRYRARAAYDGTAEVSLYLKPDCLGRGLGKEALRFIEEFAGEGGIHTLIAIICGENDRSIALFEKNGYVKCAHYKEVGKKFGRFLDVVGYQKILGN